MPAGDFVPFSVLNVTLTGQKPAPEDELLKYKIAFSDQQARLVELEKELGNAKIALLKTRYAPKDNSPAPLSLEEAAAVLNHFRHRDNRYERPNWYVRYIHEDWHLSHVQGLDQYDTLTGFEAVATAEKYLRDGPDQPSTEGEASHA